MWLSILFAGEDCFPCSPQQQREWATEMPPAKNNADVVNLDPCQVIVDLLGSKSDDIIDPDVWELIDGYLCRKSPVELGKKVKAAIEKAEDAEVADVLLKRIARFREARDKKRKKKSKKK
jgi:ribosomal protein S1